MEEHQGYKSFRTGWCQMVKGTGLVICILFLVVLCKILQYVGKVICKLKKYSSSQISQYLLNIVNEHHIGSSKSIGIFTPKSSSPPAIVVRVTFLKCKISHFPLKLFEAFSLSGGNTL